MRKLAVKSNRQTPTGAATAAHYTTVSRKRPYAVPMTTLMLMTDCSACQSALLQPYGGIYHDDCISCRGRMLGNGMEHIKQDTIKKANNGDKESINLVSMAKYWHGIKKQYLKQNER
jgi:hypothetical protein